MRALWFIGTAAIELIASVPVFASVRQIDGWSQRGGDPCSAFARTSGFCSKHGRWVIIRGGIGTVYLPDGRTFQMPLIEAEANGALDSDGNVAQAKERDDEIDDALDAAGVPH